MVFDFASQTCLTGECGQLRAAICRFPHAAMALQAGLARFLPGSLTPVAVRRAADMMPSSL